MLFTVLVGNGIAVLLNTITYAPQQAVYNHGTGLVDWTGGLDWWTGLVDWTGGLTLKIFFMVSNKTH